MTKGVGCSDRDRSWACPGCSKKTPETDGYSAVQLGFCYAEAARLSKAQRTRFEKSGSGCLQSNKSRTAGDQRLRMGDVVSVTMFEDTKKR